MVRGVEQLDAAFAAMVKERADAVMVQGSLPRKPVLDLALKHRLPSIGGSVLLSREGGLMSYSSDQNEVHRRAAFYIDRLRSFANA